MSSYWLTVLGVHGIGCALFFHRWGRAYGPPRRFRAWLILVTVSLLWPVTAPLFAIFPAPSKPKPKEEPKAEEKGPEDIHYATAIVHYVVPENGAPAAYMLEIRAGYSCFHVVMQGDAVGRLCHSALDA